MLTGRVTAVETRVQDAVLTRQDVQAAINESGVLTREQFDKELARTVATVGAEVQKWARYIGAFLLFIAGVITSWQVIWGVFS